MLFLAENNYSSLVVGGHATPCPPNYHFKHNSILEKINSPFSIGNLTLKHRLIQGPLAGYSCAPFRELFSLFTPPAFCSSEMLSANDVLHKHSIESRYLYRSPHEGVLCYQISGIEPYVMAEASLKLEDLGADLIDINCGCPKPKIRKKGAGSKLLEEPQRLIEIVKAVRLAIKIPLTVKIRLQKKISDIELAKAITDAGADAIIVHGRHWNDNYDTICDLEKIATIKRSVSIPVIANGDIAINNTLEHTMLQTNCDAFMLGRAGTGKPWIFQELLNGEKINIDDVSLVRIFITHLQLLANLEGEHQAILQSKSLIKYYFRKKLSDTELQAYYRLKTLEEIKLFFHHN